MKNKDYDLTKEMIEKVQVLSERKTSTKALIKEEENHGKEDDNDAIAITNDARFGQNVLQNQIESLRKSVSGGAKFADENGEDAESNPLVFYPKTGNLVFTGSIPSIAGLRFQFSLNDVTDAPYIFVDGLALTTDVINTLHKLSGYYKNWKESWQASTDLLDKLKKENN